MMGKKKLTPELEQELAQIVRDYTVHVEAVTEQKKKVVEKMRNGS